MFLNNYNGSLKYSVYAFMTKLAVRVDLVPAINLVYRHLKNINQSSLSNL